MHRRGVFALPLMLIAGQFAVQANLANGDPRKEKLYTRLIAPCCWRENLLAHRSPKADELRAEISQWIEAGRTEEEIQKELVTRYSLQILALPEGAPARWRWWATPAAAGGKLPDTPENGVVLI